MRKQLFELMVGASLLSSGVGVGLSDPKKTWVGSRMSKKDWNKRQKRNKMAKKSRKINRP